MLKNPGPSRWIVAIAVAVVSAHASAEPLTPAVGARIDLAQARSWTKAYRTRHPGRVRAQFFGGDILRRVLDQPGAVGMRIYLAEDEQGAMKMILLGSRADGSDIWPGPMAADALVVDRGSPCPPCSEGLELSSSIGGPIDATLARSWIARYQANHPRATKAHFFGSEILRQLIDQPHAVGMRIHLGLDETGQEHLVLVGARRDGQDILGGATVGQPVPADVVNTGLPCPPACPK